MKRIIDEIDYEKPFDGEGPFYTDFLYNVIGENYGHKYGLEQCNWEEEWYPNLTVHKTRIIKRFNSKYAYYEIGQEVPRRWQDFLQDRLDSIKVKYDNAYGVYIKEKVNELGVGYEEIYHYLRDNVHDGNTTDNIDRTDNVTKEDTENGDSTETKNLTNKFKDTPIGGVINNPTNQTEDTGTIKDVSKNHITGTNVSIVDDDRKGTSHSKNVEEYDSSRKRTEHTEHMVDELNALMDKFRDIDEMFVDEFKDMFMSIYYTEMEMS